MSNSRRHLPPRKRLGRDETFDFLVSSTTTRLPKQTEPNPKQICPRAKAPIKPTTFTAPPPKPLPYRPMSPQFKTPKPIAPQCGPFPHRAITPPPRFDSPRAMAPINTSKVATTSPPTHDNTLLAGYMAHEFLTKGTLFGQLYDATQANAPQASFSASSPTIRTMNRYSHVYVDKGKEKVVEPEPEPKSTHGYVDMGKGKTVEPEPEPKPIIDESQLTKNRRYADVSELLKNGAHVPGIVNPSQLARFLNL